MTVFIKYSAALADRAGGVNAGLLLGLLQFRERVPGEWFELRDRDVAVATRLSHSGISAARKRLVARGIVEVEQRRGPHPARYRLNRGSAARVVSSDHKDVNSDQEHVNSDQEHVNSDQHTYSRKNIKKERTEEPLEDAEPPSAEAVERGDFDDRSKAANSKDTRLQTTILTEWALAVDKRPSAVKLTSARRKAFRKAFDDGYSPSEALAAVRGIRLSAFHMGENRDGSQFNDLTIALRSLEKFRDLQLAQGAPRPSRLIARQERSFE